MAGTHESYKEAERFWSLYGHLQTFTCCDHLPLATEGGKQLCALESAFQGRRIMAHDQSIPFHCKHDVSDSLHSYTTGGSISLQQNYKRR